MYFQRAFQPSHINSCFASVPHLIPHLTSQCTTNLVGNPRAAIIMHMSRNIFARQAAQFIIKTKNDSLKGVLSIPCHLRRLVVAVCVWYPWKGGIGCG